jgi:hypothetical protein
MNALGLRVPLLCLVSVGLAACSAAGGGLSQGSEAEPATEQAAGAQLGADEFDSPLAPPDAPSSDLPASDGGDDTQGDCVCGVHLPGIDIEQGNGDISVTIDLPNERSLEIATTGNVTTSDAGVEVKGDLTIELGSGVSVALLGANLHIDAGVDARPPRITGSANVSGSLLGEACGCAEKTLPAAVALLVDPNAMVGGNAGAMLQLALDVPQLSIGAGGSISVRGNVDLTDTHVTLDTDGRHRFLKVEGDVEGNADVWTSLVPLRTDGELRATATLLDDALDNIALTGNVSIRAGALWCGLTPLTPIAMANAKVTLDSAGARLDATTTISVHPSFLLDGQVAVRGEFLPSEWSFNVDGAAMTNISDSNAEVATCLELTKKGIGLCSSMTLN